MDGSIPMQNKIANSVVNLFPSSDFKMTDKKYFIGFCAFWIFIACLEFGQDYISAWLNDSLFVVEESLSYKLFWILFIPFSIVLQYCITKADEIFPKWPYFVWNMFLAISITVLHLMLFSVILFGISNIIHEDPFTLVFLIYEKLSTRLYLGLSIYFALSTLFILVRYRKSKNQTPKAIPTTITVKNGKKSTIVDIKEINWIGSDGAYLDIHSTDQKHIVLNSLKGIIKTLPSNFKRIHKSTIINLDKIKELHSRGNGDYDVIMEDDHVLRLSRNYTEQLKGNLL